MYHFENKTAIVTGAASGMGLLFSKQFTDVGGNVVMADINAENLKREAELINQSFRKRKSLSDRLRCQKL